MSMTEPIERESEPVRPLVLIDVDCTLGCGEQSGCCQMRPGTGLLLGALFVLGYEIRLWSAGGAQHAKEWAEWGEITSVIDGYHDKPDYPPQPEAVMAMFGRLPILTIDDDPTEEIEGVGHLAVPAYTGRHRRI